MPSQSKILIVGGSSGMGLAAARAFLNAGEDVTIAGRSRDKLVAAQAALSGEAKIEEVDATSDASVADLFTRVRSIDHLVLTVGAGVPMGSFKEIGVAALNRTIETKLLAQARIAHAALGHLPEDGSITFVSGLAGRRPIPGMSAAGVANMGIDSLAYVLAKELAPVRVNVIVPGLVDTPAYDDMPADAREAMLRGAAASIPVGRVGTPEDVASAIQAVVTNGFITGTAIEIDGGAHL